MMTITQAAKLCGRSQTMIRRAIRKGHLQASTDEATGHHRIDGDELERWNQWRRDNFIETTGRPERKRYEQPEVQAQTEGSLTNETQNRNC